ncbi:MAG: TIGR00645 family protein [Pseudazoarcus pumilus]|nr:TIGR00645 family protein [Pseudazoarcus pumilus]
MQEDPGKFERKLESTIFASRWLLAPFFIGLILAIGVLLIKFAKELIALFGGALGIIEHDTVISILTLVDTALIAVLLLIIVFSGYENFVSKLAIGAHEDRPAWMGKVGFADLKMKLISAIVAISAVELLKAFLVSTTLTSEQLMWKVLIHLTFVVSGLLFAISDWISESRKQSKT